MDFTPARPARSATENIVPMINVVFLLLIFFLMTAQIAPPDPFEITPPDLSQSDTVSEGDFTVYVGADGRLSVDGIEGADALTRAANRIAGASVILRADAGVAAGRFADIMRQLSEAGAETVQLVTTEAGQ